jgi:hypothetical protein
MNKKEDKIITHQDSETAYLPADHKLLETM